MQAKVKVRVLEASDGVGGRVRTDAVDGFLLDRGFQVFLTAYPEPRRWLDLGALDFQRFFPGALVWCAGRLHKVADPLRRPLQAAAHAFNPVGSLADKLHVLDLRQQALAGSVEDVFHRRQRPSREYLRDVGFSDEMVEASSGPSSGASSWRRSCAPRAGCWSSSSGCSSRGPRWCRRGAWGPCPSSSRRSCPSAW